MDLKDFVKVFIDIVAVVISVVALIFSVFSMNRSAKYERISVSNSYRSSLLQWYNHCIEAMTRLRICNNDNNQRLIILSALSALIDEGRFFFPNVEKNNFGNDRPIGFRGYRCDVLSYLVLYFKIYQECASASDEDIDYIIKHFTSSFYKFMNPNSFISKLSDSLKESYATKLNYNNSDKEIFVLAERYSVKI